MSKGRYGYLNLLTASFLVTVFNLSQGIEVDETEAKVIAYRRLNHDEILKKEANKVSAPPLSSHLSPSSFPPFLISTPPRAHSNTVLSNAFALL